jgi:hypothetical protein
MGPYPNGNRQFGQTMKKSNKSTSRYQRQFGSKSSSSYQQQREESSKETKAAEAAARRRLRQEQGEIIDINFGYRRLEDQENQHMQQDSMDGTTLQRRGWLFHMLPTTVRFILRKIMSCAVPLADFIDFLPLTND